MKTRHIPVSLALALGMALALLWLLGATMSPPTQAQPAAVPSGVTAVGAPLTCTPISGVSVTGPVSGIVGHLYTFTAAIAPPTTTAVLPVTYTWQATEQSPVVTTASSLSHAVSYLWTSVGAKIITVTAANCGGSAVQTHTITLKKIKIYLPLVTRNWPPPTWHSTCIDCKPIVEAITQGSLALDSAGQPHVAYGGDTLYHAWRDGSGWHSEVVGEGSQVGEYAAIALDRNGYPHISYNDDSTDDLMYAYWDGTTWITETVDTDGGWDTYIALDSNGYPHIAYRVPIWISEYIIRYAWWDGTAWQKSDIANINTPSSHDLTLALDGGDQPHIGYSVSYSDEPDYLYHAYLSGGDWVTETVDTSDYIGDNALTLNSTDIPCVAYGVFVSDSGYRLRYACRDGAQWQRETAATSDYPFIAISLALDGSDTPHIGYYSYKDYNMHHVHRNGSWQVEALGQESSLDYHDRSALAIDGDGRPHLIYLLESGDLRYAYRQGGTWQRETVAQGGTPGLYNTLVLDSAGNPHVVYVDYDRQELRYAVWDGDAWQTQPLKESTWHVPNYAGLALDGNDYPHVAYNYWKELWYTHWDGSAWQSEKVLETSGSVTSEAAALLLDGAGRPHIIHGTWDGIAHTWWDGSAWRTETVDDAPALSVGRFGLAMDGAGTLYLAYRDSTNQVLKYAYRDGGGWHVQTVDTGLAPALALDGAGNPHISYCWKPGDYCQELRYASWDGAAWQIETVDNDRGYDTSLAFDSAGRPCIGYSNWSIVKPACWDGAQWQIEEVVPGAYNSMVLDADDNPHFTYFAGGMHYAWRGP